MLDRKAALLLHAMPEQDRQWVIERLTPQQHAQVEALLQEIQALGIPGDPGLLADIQAWPDAAMREGSAVCTDAERLDRCDAAALTAVLTTEPPAFALKLLSLRPWAWRNDVAWALGLAEALAARRTQAGPGGAGFEAAAARHLLARLDADVAAVGSDGACEPVPGRTEAPVASPVPPAAWATRLRSGLQRLGRTSGGV